MAKHKMKQLAWLGMLAFGLGFFICPFGADLIWNWVIMNFGNGDYLTGTYWLYGISIALMVGGLLLAYGFKGSKKFMVDNPEIPVLIVAGTLLGTMIFPYLGGY